MKVINQPNTKMQWGINSCIELAPIFPERKEKSQRNDHSIWQTLQMMIYCHLSCSAFQTKPFLDSSYLINMGLSQKVCTGGFSHCSKNVPSTNRFQDDINNPMLKVFKTLHISFIIFLLELISYQQCFFNLIN